MLPRLRLLSILALFAAVGIDAAQAESGKMDTEITASQVRISEVNLGFSGKYRVGLWTIARVKLVSDATTRGRLAVVCPDGDGIAARYRPLYEGFHSLEAGKEATISVAIRPGRTAGWLRVEWEGEAGDRAERTFGQGEIPEAVLASQQLVVTLGNEVGIDAAVAQHRRSDTMNQATIAARVESVSELPEVWYGYEGVSAIAIGSQSSAAGVDLLKSASPAQIAALDRWIRMGGRAIVSVGKRGGELLVASPVENIATAEQFFSGLSPGRFTGLARQRTTTGLESYAGAAESLETIGEDRVPLELALFRDLTGEVIIEERSGAEIRPVVVKKAHGFGIVAFVSSDLDRPPLSTWSDRPRLVGKLLSLLLAEQRSEAEDRRTSQLSNVGYTDLAGQLRAALDDFPSLATIGFVVVALAICLYIALIGPLDYFFLRRFLPEQMESTWITYPLAVVLFCGGAWLASSWLKGDRERSNQLEVIDVDVATHPGRALVTGQLWTHIYRPETHVYNLRLTPPAMPPNEIASGSILSYQGLPGGGFDGMHASSTTPTWPRTYEVVAKEGQVSGLPIEVASTKSLYGRWWWEGKFPAEIDLRDTTSRAPLGEFMNPLPLELHDCHLLYHRWITPDLGALGPGQKFKIGDDLRPIDLEYMLTKRPSGETKEPGPRWDAQSRDMKRLVEIFLFHEAAGGQSHTRLTHRYQPSVDMTSLLHSNRAVLLGRAKNRAARLHDRDRAIGEEDDGHWTWYRVVFPVKPADWKPRAEL